MIYILTTYHCLPVRSSTLDITILFFKFNSANVQESYRSYVDCKYGRIIASVDQEGTVKMQDINEDSAFKVWTAHPNAAFDLKWHDMDTKLVGIYANDNVDYCLC
jgi:hypothetical protein